MSTWRTQLKALQFLRGGRRWVLKSPQHLGQLPVLDAVFPGVIVAFTHRDPVPVALSMIAMITYCERMHRDRVASRIAAGWVDRLERLLAACVRDRDAIPAERSVDIRFDDFMADELGAAEQVVRAGRRAVTDDARTAITEYLDGHRRGRLGRVATSARCSDWTKTTCARASRRTSAGSCRSPYTATGLRDWRASCTRIAARQMVDRIAMAIAKVSPAVCNPHRRAARPSPTTGSEIATYATTK